jgi:hypothetical protein
MKLIILFLVEIFEHSFSALKNLGNIVTEDALHFIPNFLRVLYHTFRDYNETAWMIIFIILCIIIIYLYIKEKKKPNL